MIRRFALLCLLCVCGSSALSAPIEINGLPSSFTPGQSFSFEVSLPPVANLGAYNIDLLLTGSSGAAGTDFSFNLAGTDVASSGYVFPSAANYFDSVNVDSPLVQRLSLTDFDLTGVSVVDGVNDRIATVFVDTVGGFDGSLTIALDFGGLILDTPDTTPTPVAEFSQTVADTQAAGDFGIAPIPEPTAIILFTLGGSAGLACRRFLA